MSDPARPMQGPNPSFTDSSSGSATQAPSARPPLGQFLPPLIFPPSSQHRSTIIFLHGRGSNAQKFAGPLLSSPVSGHGTRPFRDALPNTRFVFPTAPLARATKYRRSVIHQWYDGTGDWEPEARGNMGRSIEHMHDLIRHEIRLLGGEKARVVLAGISQGCAMALMCMLLWNGPALSAVVGICGFMPLNTHLTGLLGGDRDGSAGRQEGEDDGDDVVVFVADGADDGQESDELSPLEGAIAELREEAELSGESAEPSTLSFLATPVFIGHGTEDENVEICHGEQAAALLGLMGLAVQFRRYRELGHWYSAEMLEDIVEFLAEKGGVDKDG